MKWLQTFCLILGCLCGSLGVYAQDGGESKAEYLPDAIYEIRYWTNMMAMDGKVHIDTLIFFNNDRASFEYPNTDCISCPYRSTDSLVYTLMPKFNTSEKEWVMGNNFVRKSYRVIVNFAKYDRAVYKVYVSDMKNKDTGMGQYVFASKQFGVIYRYDARGNVIMLNRIDVMQNGRILDEIDVLPLQLDLQNNTDIFTGRD